MRFLLSVLHSSSLSSSARLSSHTAGHRQYMPITHTSSRLVPPYPLSTLHSHWRQREAATLEIFSYLVSVLSSPSIPSCFSHHAPQLLFLSLSLSLESLCLPIALLYSTLSYPILIFLQHKLERATLYYQPPSPPFLSPLFFFWQ